METTNMENVQPGSEPTLRMHGEIDTFGSQNHLSPREREIVLLLVNGYVATEAIARKLNISIFTVKNHLQNIFQKTDTKSKSQILSRFIKDCCSVKSEAAQKRFDRPLVVLLADDDFKFQGLIQQAAEKVGGVPANMVFVNDGQELMHYLERSGEGGARYIRPDIILLDLDMTKLDGLGALEKMKATEKLRDIPVVAIAEQDHSDEVKKMYQSGGHSYFVKTSEVSDLVDIMTSIMTYWSDLATLPPAPRDEAH